VEDRTNAILESNQRSLKRLTRIVQFSQEFSLAIARCNFRVLQNHCLQDLRSQLARLGIPEQAIATIELKPEAKTLLDSIQTLMERVHQLAVTDRPKILMILGLDAVKDVEAVLKSANRVREEFKNCLEFPMVLWLNDRVQDILTRNAPDLANWATAGAIAFQFTPAELLELVKARTEAMFDRFLDTSKAGFMRAIADELQQYELMTAVAELEANGEVLDLELKANLNFAFGCLEFTKSGNLEAKAFFLESLAVWQERNLSKKAVCLLQLGMCDRMEAFRCRYDKEKFYQSSQAYLTECIAIFRQLERWDLVAEYINFLMAAVEDLASVRRSPPAPLDKGGESGLMRELESLAVEALALRSRYPSLLKEAHDRGILAVVKLAEQDYAAALVFVESSLALYHEAEKIKLPSLRFSERYLYGKYELWSARALAGLRDSKGAIARLESVCDRWQHQHDPQIYISILEELRSLYTAEGLYLEAFRTKQHQRSIEQQYGLRAFIGAGTLNPKREVNDSEIFASRLVGIDGIAQEIEASGRMPDVLRLVDRIRQARFPLTVMHGDSGAGKSSILKGGVIPALRAKETMDGRKVLVLMVNTYKDWSNEIKRQLHEFFGDTRSDLNPIEHFKHNVEANYLTVLVFDQFEDFFFKKEDFHDRLPFYKFLRACLHTDFVRVVLSLREDYLHYLLECDRAVDLEKVENDILGKSVRYYLGDFTPEQAKQAIVSLTARAQVKLDDDLCDRLVTDLTGDRGRILPIELQVVGSQLESEQPVITTLAQYLALISGDRPISNHKPSEILVERWLENVVKDCGAANQELAQRVLYALTGTEEKRPQKTQEELAMELITSPPTPLLKGEGSKNESLRPLSPWERGLGGKVNLELILAVLVGSGLAFRVSGMQGDRYQLIHDYLVSFIRKKYVSVLSKVERYF
jgi:tetratricopeptide (TPR) repeat protein